MAQFESLSVAAPFLSRLQSDGFPVGILDQRFNAGSRRAQNALSGNPSGKPLEAGSRHERTINAVEALP